MQTDTVTNNEGATIMLADLRQQVTDKRQLQKLEDMMIGVQRCQTAKQVMTYDHGNSNSIIQAGLMPTWGPLNLLVSGSSKESLGVIPPLMNNNEKWKLDDKPRLPSPNLYNSQHLQFQP